MSEANKSIEITRPVLGTPGRDTRAFVTYNTSFRNRTTFGPAKPPKLVSSTGSVTKKCPAPEITTVRAKKPARFSAARNAVDCVAAQSRPSRAIQSSSPNTWSITPRRRQPRFPGDASLRDPQTLAAPRLRDDSQARQYAGGPSSKRQRKQMRVRSPAKTLGRPP